MHGSDTSSSSHILSEKGVSPSCISWKGWWCIILNTIKALINGPSTLVAAGCAFFSTLSLFPSISSLISIYGLVFDPQTVEPQLIFLAHFLPPSVYIFFQEMIHRIVGQTSSTLTIQLGISILFTIWSSAVGTKGLINGLNIVYDVQEERNFFRFQILALSLTFCAILGTTLTLAIIVALPAVLSVLPLQFLDIIGDYFPEFNMIQIMSKLIVLLFVVWTFSLFYRFGPCRSDVRWRWIYPGAIIATILWLLFAYVFSFYVAHLANFSSTYGPLGTIVAVMMWFLVSCYVVLVGAQFNSKIESYIIQHYL